MTYQEAEAKLPDNAQWSSSFGNVGDSFPAIYSEYYRDESHAYCLQHKGGDGKDQWTFKEV